MSKKARDLDAIIEELPQKQREGLTVNGEEVVSSSDEATPTTSQLIGHMKDETPNVGRMPRIHFVAEEDPTEMWSIGDDRLLGGADITVSKELFAAAQLGYVCIRCWEPQEESYPIHCSLCSYEMRERQANDIGLEFDGYKHLGPSKPIQEYQDLLEEEQLKKQFAKKIADGKSRMKGLIRRGS